MFQEAAPARSKVPLCRRARRSCPTVVPSIRRSHVAPVGGTGSPRRRRRSDVWGGVKRIQVRGCAA
eukprot:11133360-Lingulodinium_polyedra.AAC.1